MNYQIGTFPYTLFMMFLTIIGIYGVLIKLGQRSRLAFVPYINFAKLGDAIDMPVVGIITALLGICDFAFAGVSFHDLTKQTMDLLAWINLADDLLFVIFRMILLNGLRKTFDQRGIWMLAFFFFPGLTLAYWGYSKKIQL